MGGTWEYPHLNIMKSCWHKCVGWERYTPAAVPLGWQAFGVLTATLIEACTLFGSGEPSAV